MLDSIPTIQKTAKRALVDGFTGRPGGIMPEDPEMPEVSILVLIRENRALVLLDTSGDPLHKRGYRVRGVEAPLKETLAAGLILLSNWRFSEPFRDPFCGSGTIAIEAAMIAKNIAPGILRSFAFERFPFAGTIPLSEEREACRKAEKWEKNHDIAASDSDPEAIAAAQSNAAVIGLSNTISFEVAEFSETKLPNKGTLVTNPPYGERLSDIQSAKQAHENLFAAFRKFDELSGGIITGLEGCENMAKGLGMKNRKIPNGSIPCRYFFRTSNRG